VIAEASCYIDFAGDDVVLVMGNALHGVESAQPKKRTAPNPSDTGQ